MSTTIPLWSESLLSIFHSMKVSETAMWCLEAIAERRIHLLIRLRKYEYVGLCLFTGKQYFCGQLFVCQPLCIPCCDSHISLPVSFWRRFISPTGLNFDLLNSLYPGIRCFSIADGASTVQRAASHGVGETGQAEKTSFCSRLNLESHRKNGYDR